MTDSTPRRTALLLILDGWGYREETDSNAIAAANTPVWDQLWRECPHTLITTSGTGVGLPSGQMGNSEVGHMNLGAGRVVYQSLTMIDKAIETGDFFDNTVLSNAARTAAANDKAMHIMGLLSPGGIHSHENHILAMIRLAQEAGVKQVYVHAFLDGRDMPPRSAMASLQKTEKALTDAGLGRIVSVIGRYFAMDRDQRWDRMQSAYDLITQGEASHEADSVADALNNAYARDEDDEFVKATRIGTAVPMRDGDSMVFMNFRADRARQLTSAFVDPGFDGFKRKSTPKLAEFVMLTEYSADLKQFASCAYPPQTLHNSLGEYLASEGRTQLRIAETEKYAHVTFFFSGGREQPYEGEDRILIPSPDVATYDLQPEMSAPEVTDKLDEAIRSGKYDAIICNYANGDMVGHTGSFDAAVKAVETLDVCLGRLMTAIRDTGGQCLITADHGNVEQMMDAESGQALTSHTSGPVPLVYVGQRQWHFTREGALSDIAPTLLKLMDMEVPAEMTGHVLMAP
ncbi:2,3-bisphosphoglycerate-independent phosphoglycerate mutase [Pseudohongiella sp.]|uniref:2,3-bisphosphoglycerate-independent phosphoglycerate mutase n=1 Tax=marine sediment metagenome TaxID=412755 RepID=A0A0F9W751_9ZZZZ|nr:2,3-bisphosphoglycerate-independent phosphoglycerate mutase [Pseudohongiella sp.]HDZ09330.1 2,3-bisphosphoglycerate-independent phosphoglycerate mutase [Pseudohongiella sp.]HEA63821.1 2,3-bisphosphoglycerate-independent phosphoglycerate mutase [Pseudohongiella sp.]